MKIVVIGIVVVIMPIIVIVVTMKTHRSILLLTLKARFRSRNLLSDLSFVVSRDPTYAISDESGSNYASNTGT